MAPPVLKCITCKTSCNMEKTENMRMLATFDKGQRGIVTWWGCIAMIVQVRSRIALRGDESTALGLMEQQQQPVDLLYRECTWSAAAASRECNWSLSAKGRSASSQTWKKASSMCQGIYLAVLTFDGQCDKRNAQSLSCCEALDLFFDQTKLLPSSHDL